MTEIEILKREAYQIATNTKDNGDRYSVDVRNEAMKNYALLVIAEALNQRKEE